ncbi:MAG: glycoside hydrolase family 32 protein, partial [Planctomycetota bacterium]|nr:glycoside hydrolase family 32 protein [Planctomycetota bacterium]
MKIFVRSVLCIATTVCIAGLVPCLAADADERIERAMRALETGAESAKADPTRPTYHYRPPSGWISDPDGPIYHKGFYHTFYIHNPFGPQGWPRSRNHWGHACSRDLVLWEHLPVALAPLFDREHRCNSGCLAIDGRGRPLIFYTHVPLNNGPNEQWAAVGDDDLITWKRVPENPILSLKTHGGPRLSKHWRDPFIFKTDGRTFMILTANLGGNAVAPIYEATNTSLLDWKYRGIMFKIPKNISTHFECPNFVKLGQKWVLIGSGLDKSYAIRYFTGTFDAKTLRFTPEIQGLVDHLDNFLYATNIIHDDRGRCVMLARVKHFKTKGRAWNGCLALPRLLSIDTQGRLIQKPMPELKKLRQEHFSAEPFELKSTTRVIDEVEGDSLEILVTFKPGDAKAFGLNLRRSRDGKRGVLVRYDGRKFTFGEHIEGKLVACVQHGDRSKVPGGVLPFNLS